MTTLPNLTNEIAELGDNDLLYVWNASTPSTPDAKMRGSRLRPLGAKVSHYFRFEGDIVIPALAAGVAADAAVTVTGVLAGDHVQFNLAGAPPTDICIEATWSEANAVKVRFRNRHATNAFAGASVACIALVTRALTP